MAPAPDPPELRGGIDNTRSPQQLHLTPNFVAFARERAMLRHPPGPTKPIELPVLDNSPIAKIGSIEHCATLLRERNVQRFWYPVRIKSISSLQIEKGGSHDLRCAR